MKHTMIGNLPQAAHVPSTREELAALIRTEQQQRIERANRSKAHYRILTREPGVVTLAGPRGNHQLDYKKRSCSCDDAKHCKRRNLQAELASLDERLYCKHWRIVQLLARPQVPNLAQFAEAQQRRLWRAEAQRWKQHAEQLDATGSHQAARDARELGADAVKSMRANYRGDYL